MFTLNQAVGKASVVLEIGRRILRIAGGLTLFSLSASAGDPFAPLFAPVVDGCPALLQATPEARVTALYAKLLAEYRKTAGEEGYAAWVERALSEREYFSAGATHSDQGAILETLEKLGMIHEKGKLPNGEVVSSVAIERDIRTYLEEELRALRRSGARVEEAVRKSEDIRPISRLLSGGHREAVSFAKVRADFKRAISASNDGVLILWDLEHARPIRVFREHQAAIDSLHVSADFKRAVTSSMDGKILVWDLENGALLHALNERSDPGTWMTGFRVSPDFKRALASQNGGVLLVWDVENGGLLHRLEDFRSYAVSADFKRIVEYAWEHKNLAIWNLESGQPLHALAKDARKEKFVGASDDLRYAVSRSGDQTLKVWDLRDGRTLSTLKGSQGSGNGEIAFLRINARFNRIVGTEQDGTLTVWNLETGEIIRVLRGHTEKPTLFQASPDFKRALTWSSGEQKWILWDLEKGEVIHSAEGIKHVKVSADLKRAIGVSVEQESVVTWDLGTAKELHRFSLKGSARKVFAHEVETLDATSDFECVILGLDTGENVIVDLLYL